MQEQIGRLVSALGIAVVILTVAVFWLVFVAGWSTPATVGITLMASLLGVLLLAAAIFTLAHAINRAPLWPAVLCVIVALVVQFGVRLP